MAEIHIKRNHRLGLESAREKVEKIAQKLKTDLQADYAWDGDRLLFKRIGATGAINVGSDYISVDIELGMALALLKGAIEENVQDTLDAALS